MSSDAIAIFLGLLVGGLGVLTVVLLTVFVVGSWVQHNERERRYERMERERYQQLPMQHYQPPVIVVQGQLPNRLTMDPNANSDAEYPVVWRQEANHVQR